VTARRTHGTILLALAAALLASTAACGDARAPASTATADCTSCHGYPPATDLHAIHFAADDGSSGVPHAQLACLNCHLNVTSVNQPDHILRADGTRVPSPAEVRFDDAASLAALTQPGATRAGAPAYDRTARTCSNIYCHGAGLKGATSDIVLAPAWNAPHGTVGCGNCHGIPPADPDHPAGLTQLDCSRCHVGAIDAQGNLNPATHVDGKVEVSLPAR
jgi:predicted CxxxxCH...CXXCH cytochrome family protein